MGTRPASALHPGRPQRWNPVLSSSLSTPLLSLFTLALALSQSPFLFSPRVLCGKLSFLDLLSGRLVKSELLSVCVAVGAAGLESRTSTMSDDDDGDDMPQLVASSSSESESDDDGPTVLDAACLSHALRALSFPLLPEEGGRAAEPRGTAAPGRLLAEIAQRAPWCIA